uniref:Gustatory receptor n=1 Tax=Anopheles coluzzii TaxID=1518534 RepID=A0A6E8UZJ3_ANOCL
MKAKSGNRELFESLLRFPKRDVFDCVPLHYLVLKMSGMGCITPRAGVRNGSTMTTLIDIGLFVTNLILAVTMMIYGMFITQRHMQSPIMFIGLKMVNFTCYASTIYGLISCFINRHDIWKFYNEAYAVDNMLEELGERTNFTRSFALFVAYYGTAIGMCVLVIAVMYSENLPWMLLLNLGYSYFSLTTFHILSLTCLDVVRARNVRLNKVFRKQFSLEGDVADPPALTVYDPKQTLILHQIMQIFDKISDLADKGSYYYGIQIMVSIAGSFVYLMFYTFAFTLVIRSVLPAEIVFNAGPIISYSMFAYNVFIVAFYGNALKQQCAQLCFASTFDFVLVFGLISTLCESVKLTLLRMFLMQLGHRSPMITCGLFPFDWTLIFSILSTAATYIIILLQFESAGSSSG